MPVIKRAAVLGQLMQGRIGVAVAGTHGKTTTTAMVALILREAGRDPAFLVGGVLRDLGTGGHWGGGPELVVEADEYDGSFWQLAPTSRGDHEHRGRAPRFLRRPGRGTTKPSAALPKNVQPGGTLFCCGDDPGAARLAARTGRRTGRSATAPSMVYGTRRRMPLAGRGPGRNAKGGSDFTAYHQGQPVAEVGLRCRARTIF